jgi:hypothetical protein
MSSTRLYTVKSGQWYKLVTVKKICLEENYCSHLDSQNFSKFSSERIGLVEKIVLISILRIFPDSHLSLILNWKSDSLHMYTHRHTHTLNTKAD